VQVALALVLLVGSGLMIRTFQQLRRVQPGFTHPEEIQIVHSSIPEAIAEDPVRVMRMWDELRDTLAALPGVTSVGFASGAPLESLLGFRNIQRLYAEDQTLPSGQASPEHRLIAPGFFSTMGTRLIAGRDFTWTICMTNGTWSSCRRIWHGSGGTTRAPRWANGFVKAPSLHGAKLWASSKTSMTGACK
jgi:hypothetical protein